MVPVNPSQLLEGSTDHSLAREELANNWTEIAKNNATVRVIASSVGSTLGTKSWQHPHKYIVVDQEMMAERGADVPCQ
jgi:hypothetical protein